MWWDVGKAAGCVSLAALLCLGRLEHAVWLLLLHCTAGAVVDNSCTSLQKRRKMRSIIVKPVVMVGAMRLPDYVAIGVLIALVVWAAADLIPHDKFKL